MLSPPTGRGEDEARWLRKRSANEENSDTPHRPFGPAGLRRGQRTTIGTESANDGKRRAPEDSAREQEWTSTRWEVEVEVEKQTTMVTTSSETADDARIVEFNKKYPEMQAAGSNNKQYGWKVW